MPRPADNHPRPLPPLSPQDAERFWSKVRKGNPDQCWESTAATIGGRGGVFRVMDGPGHRTVASLLRGQSWGTFR